VRTATEPDKASVLSQTQRGENRTIVSMRLLHSLVQMAREDTEVNRNALERAKYIKYGIAPFLCLQKIEHNFQNKYTERVQGLSMQSPFGSWFARTQVELY